MLCCVTLWHIQRFLKDRDVKDKKKKTRWSIHNNNTPDTWWWMFHSAALTCPPSSLSNELCEGYDNAVVINAHSLCVGINSSHGCPNCHKHGRNPWKKISIVKRSQRSGGASVLSRARAVWVARHPHCMRCAYIIQYAQCVQCRCRKNPHS